MQDIFGWFGKKAKKNRYTYSKQKHALRIIFFVMMLISLVLGGGTIVQLLAPYSTTAMRSTIRTSGCVPCQVSSSAL